MHTTCKRSNYRHSSVSGLNNPERRMRYLLADQMRDGGRALIVGSNWSSCVISTSLTPAGGPSLPGGFQSAWGVETSRAVGVCSGCLCLSSQLLKPFSGDWWSESWWLLKSGIREARVTPLTNNPLRRKRWTRLLLTAAKSFTDSDQHTQTHTHRWVQKLPDSICSNRLPGYFSYLTDSSAVKSHISPASSDWM